MKWVFPLFSLLLLISLPMRAELRVAGVFSDNMVLQSGSNTPVWGWAEPGESVTVSYGAIEATTQTDASGRWEVVMPDLPVNAEGRHLICTGNTTVSFANVVVGDVWFCSGQSNMSWTMEQTDDTEALMQDVSAYANIRVLDLPPSHSGEPSDDIAEGEWALCTPESIRQFSAIGFLFARELMLDQSVPVGVIVSAVGGSNGKLWVSRKALRRDVNLSREIAQYEKRMEKWNVDAANRQYEKRLTSWKKRAAKAEQLGKRIPKEPVKPVHPRDSYQRHGSYFNGMVYPIMPLAVRGILLYHGQANANAPEEYGVLFPMLIRDWREHWGRGDIPFVFVQLPNFRKVQFEPIHKRDKLPYLREAQTLALKELETGMVVTTDIGDAREPHPRNKLEVAKRLYQTAREVAYKKTAKSQCPTYIYMKASGRKLIVHFDHLGGGLRARGGELKGFAITGSDRQWRWANAEIVGNTVHVSHPEVLQPAAVRYNWADNPIGNLFSIEGYPASSFRTDTWTRDSISKRDREKWAKQ